MQWLVEGPTGTETATGLWPPPKSMPSSNMKGEISQDQSKSSSIDWMRNNQHGQNGISLLTISANAAKLQSNTALMLSVGSKKAPLCKMQDHNIVSERGIEG
jgi:hypothetical protein